VRIDKLLWFLRLAPTRTLAHDWVAEGHFRLNGRRIEKPSVALAVGDILTIPARSGVRVIELIMVPARRGPAAEAFACYRTLDERAANPIAAENNITPEGT
jgi:ribosome-associated heat shock protein Hsp15